MRFEIDPQPGESLRACTAIARTALPTARGNAIVLAMYVLVGVASFVFTPATTLTTFMIGVGAVLGTVTALQLEGKSRLRRLRASDPHALETHFVELTPEGVRTWCAHVDARYPWQDFSKVAENAEFYLFVRPNGSGSAVPKRLVDPATAAALRERIREWGPKLELALAPEVVG